MVGCTFVSCPRGWSSAALLGALLLSGCDEKPQTLAIVAYLPMTALLAESTATNSGTGSKMGKIMMTDGKMHMPDTRIPPLNQGLTLPGSSQGSHPLDVTPKLAFEAYRAARNALAASAAMYDPGKKLHGTDLEAFTIKVTLARAAFDQIPKTAMPGTCSVKSTAVETEVLPCIVFSSPDSNPLSQDDELLRSAAADQAVSLSERQYLQSR